MQLTATRADGTTVKLLFFVSAANTFDMQVSVKWPGYDDFTPYTDQTMSGSQGGLVQQILTDGGVWNTSAPDASGPTWAELYAGASYTSPRDGQTYTGLYAVNAKFRDYLLPLTVAEIDAATNHWATNIFLPWAVNILEGVNNMTPPAPPVPEPPMPLDQPGLVGNSYGVALAQAQRLTCGTDPANPQRFVVAMT